MFDFFDNFSQTIVFRIKTTQSATNFSANLEIYEDEVMKVDGHMVDLQRQIQEKELNLSLRIQAFETNLNKLRDSGYQ